MKSNARPSRGSVLVEFAFVSLVFYLLLGATIDLGRMVFTAQVAQDAARLAARELSLLPFPATYTFEQAMADPLALQRVYNDDYLVVDLDQYATEDDLNAFFDGLPLVNQALRPLMISDTRDIAGTTRHFLRYPGALITDPGSPTGFSVAIPEVVSRNADGIETIRWVPIIEEVRSDPANPANGPFSMAAPVQPRGVVAVRINVPFQAAALSGYQNNGAALGDPNVANPILADDAAVVELGTPQPVLPDDGAAGPYAGPYGLGRQLALNEELRPFRKLVTSQAFFRREIFQ